MNRMAVTVARALMLTAAGATALVATGARAVVDPYEGISQVEVFANSAMLIRPGPIDRFSFKIYRLDGIVLAEQLLSQGLPPKQADAEAYFARHGAESKAKVKSMVLEAAAGLRLASYYKLERLPAIVVNGRTAIFGTTDVSEAIARYQQAARLRGQLSASEGIAVPKVTQ